MSAAQRILLLGGTGFLGTHAAAALLQAGHDVTVLSRGTRPAPAGTSDLVADRRDPSALARALEGRRFDFTVDCAAYDDADIDRLLLVPYAALGRYVLISSGQVYLVTQSRRIPYREEDSDLPLMAAPPVGSSHHGSWIYGMGKRRAEGALLALRALHGVRAVILRLPVILGESDGSLRLWAYLERMLDGGPILLPDGGARPTRFLYVGDVARALVHLLDSPPPRLAVYNLAQPDVVPLRDLLERIARAAGTTPRFVDAGWSEIEASGIEPSFSPYAGKWVSVLDPSRAAGELGFLGTRLDEYLPIVVRWHLEHRPTLSHSGYGQRAREREYAERVAAGRG